MLGKYSIYTSVGLIGNLIWVSPYGVLDSLLVLIKSRLKSD